MTLIWNLQPEDYWTKTNFLPLSLMENKVFCTRNGHAPIFSDAHQCALAHIGNIREYMCKYMHKYLHFPHPHGHPYFALINSTCLLQFKSLKEDIFASSLCSRISKSCAAKFYLFKVADQNKEKSVKRTKHCPRRGLSWSQLNWKEMVGGLISSSLGQNSWS